MSTPLPSHTQPEAWSSLPKLPVWGLLKKSWHLILSHDTLWRLMAIFSVMVLAPLLFGAYAVHTMTRGETYILTALQVLSAFGSYGAYAGSFFITLPVLDIALGRDTHVRTFKEILSLAYLKPLFGTKRFAKIVLLIVVAAALPMLPSLLTIPFHKQGPATTQRPIKPAAPITSSRVVSKKELNAEGQIVRHHIKTVTTVHENTPSAHVVPQGSHTIQTQSHDSTSGNSLLLSIPFIVMLIPFIIMFIPMMWHVVSLYVTTRFLPLYGSLADEKPRPVSRAWHLSRHSFWRLFFASVMTIALLGFLGALLLGLTLPFTPTLGGKLLVALPLAACIGGINIFLYVYYGLAYRFLEDTRGPLLDRGLLTSQGATLNATRVAPTPQQKNQQKGTPKGRSSSVGKTPPAKAKPRTAVRKPARPKKASTKPRTRKGGTPKPPTQT
ncbi:hypothetical protein [Candidatus Hepatobacter penaei]|uniref:hypothetical protein n=1 Tax=Candidatus Hepatobacter penaei TaxID=1274402 RepID=UPI0004F39ED8|nr:hypothetical protein [Candidatus Hepatobacter penaei]